MDLEVILNVAAVAFILFLSVTDAVLPSGECFVEELTCELENNNVIGIINGISTAEECKKECQDNSNDCKIYSYCCIWACVWQCILFLIPERLYSVMDYPVRNEHGTTVE